MSYNYRSPLQNEYEYNNPGGSGYSWFHSGLLQHPRPGPRVPPPSDLRPRGYRPYSVPGSSSQAPTYSSRYQLSTYPKELNDLFGALNCDLCAVEVSSPIVAKMHYSGKQHMKKVKNFLTEWSLKTGNPIPNIDQRQSQTSGSGMADYCELCDVRLISMNDKMLHYSGKTHRKNEKDPANAKKKGKTYDTIDLSNTDGRFGIGLGFSSDSKALAPTEGVQVNDFVCDLCHVKAVSQEQLNTHLSGKKHKEKLKKKESGVPKAERPYKCDICDVSLETPRQLQLHLDGKPHAKLLKKLEEEFKGETCELCDIHFKSYRDYHNHLNGQKHQKKKKQKDLRTSAIVKYQKETIACRKCPYIGDLDNHFCDKSLENVAINIENPNNSWKCVPCYDMIFQTEEEYEEHKKSRRHLLCMLNIEGDKITEDKIHYYCFTCRKQYYDNKEYCEHLFGHKHLTLANETFNLGSKTDLWHCNVCSIIMDQKAKDEHMMSKHHFIQAAQQDITKTLTSMAQQELFTHTFHCTHCKQDFFNFVAYSDHILDTKHLEALISAKLAADS